MPARKYDYRSLEAEYVRGSMTIHDLCKTHDIPTPSTVYDQARKPDGKGRTWYDKRIEFQSITADRAMIVMADVEARRLVRVQAVTDNAIDAIDEAISKMRSDMRATRTVIRRDEAGNPQEHQEPLMRIAPKELALLLDRLAVLFGRPSAITEGRELGITISADEKSDLGAAALARLTAATRGGAGLARVSGRGDPSTSPLPRSPESSPH